MASIRLSGLTIFLILLAVILVGYVLHNTWENFTSCNKEGFTLDYKESTIVSDALYGQYSQDNKKLAKLAEHLYYDPVARVLIEKSGDILYMKRKDGTDLSHNVTTTEFDLEDLGPGAIRYDGIWTSGENEETPQKTVQAAEIKTSLGLDASIEVNLGHAKAYFKTLGVNEGIYMGAHKNGGPVPTADTDIIDRILLYSPAGIAVSVTGEDYPPLDSRSETSQIDFRRKFKRTMKPSGFLVSQAETGSAATSFGWHTLNGLGVVYIPLNVNGAETNTTFIHVMDTHHNKHLGTYYFKGNQVEMFNYTNIAISSSSFPTDTDMSNTNASDLTFSGDLATMVLPNNSTDENLYTDVHHDSAKELVYFAARVDNDAVRCYIQITNDRLPVIVKSETSHGTTNTAAPSTSTSATPSTTTSTITELTSALNLIQTIQNTFGTSDSNYLLKTEVVPPVCPACPSCSSSNGVCTTCGGNGGSGTQSGNGSTSLAEKAGTGVTNLVRDGADGATNLARDAASGTYEVGKEVVTGTGNAISSTASGVGQFAKDTGSGVGQFAKDTGSGVGQFAKDTGSGVFNAAKDVGSGAYGVAQDVTSGTIGLGREMAGGVGNMFSGPGASNGGYNNSYGGPSYNGGYNQGGYMAPQQPATAGQDPYSYYGAVPPRYGGCKYMPRTADFSSFGR